MIPPKNQCIHHFRINVTRQFFLPPEVLQFFLFSGHHFFAFSTICQHFPSFSWFPGPPLPPNRCMIFPHFPSIFPTFSSRFSWFPGPSPFSKLRRRDDERHNVGRGKGLGKDAGAAARQAGEVRLIRLAAQVGAPWGW